MFKLEHEVMTPSTAARWPPYPHQSERSPPPNKRQGKSWSLAVWSLAALVALLLWDFSGADLPMARWAGDAQGFALRSDAFMTGVAHDGAKRLSWALVLALCAAVWWPIGPWKTMSVSRRLELAVLPLIAGLSVSGLKALSLTSCPWDLREFGGVAQYLSHWHIASDGGAGRCFPGGHAAHGFSMMAGYFVFRDRHPRLAKRWLIVAVTAGLLLGLVQQWRGAHFMSHTLWTGWLCWMLLWGLDALWRKAEP